MMNVPEPAAVKAWGELPGQRNLPGALQVLVAGQSVGGAEPVGAEWRACWYTAAFRDRCTAHPTAEEAVAAVLASGLARRLGARKASRVYWSDKARRRAVKGTTAANAPRRSQ